MNKLQEHVTVNENNKSHINVMLLVSTLLFSALVIIVLMINKSLIKNIVEDVFDMITTKFGAFYIGVYCVSVFFSLFLIFSRKGDIVLGEENDIPQYSLFEWASMLFCTIIGSVMVMAFIEPIYYLSDPPFELESLSVEAYEYAHLFGQFHWGPTALTFFAPASVMVAYHLYVKKGSGHSIGNVFFECGLCNKGIGLVLDIVSVLAILGGVGTSMGLSSPIVCKIISSILSVPNNNLLIVAVFLGWFFVFFTSVWKGLNKGIKKLSCFNVVFAGLIVIYIAIIAGPINVLDAELNSIGLYLHDFFRMSFQTDPFGKGGFPQRWSVFFWAWYLAYVPMVGVFIAKISKGRTVRQVTAGIMAFGSLGAVFAFAVMGYYSLSLQQSGTVDLVQILNTEGKDSVIMAIINTLPGSRLILGLFATSIIVFISTTIDSTAFVISLINMSQIQGEDSPPRWLRACWAVIILLFALSLTMIGGLEIVQTASVVLAFPMIVIQLIVIVYVLRRFKSIPNRK